MTRENHTLKRALTDPHFFSGIGNAYSDEILHAARLSPMQLTSRLTPEQIASLHGHVVSVLTKWRDALIAETGDGFPEKVTAFRDEMAAHGRYGKPCPVCGTAIQRIKYASNEANYCPTCQTGGKLLADRGLSRLLKGDWPKTLEELEQYKSRQAKACHRRVQQTRLYVAVSLRFRPVRDRARARAIPRPRVPAPAPDRSRARAPGTRSGSRAPRRPVAPGTLRAASAG